MLTEVKNDSCPGQSETRRRSLIVTVPLLLALVGLPGCGEQKFAAPDDGVMIKDGKSLSFDLLKSRLESVKALNDVIGRFQKADKTLYEALHLNGAEWAATSPQELRLYHEQIKVLKNSLSIAQGNQAFSSIKSDLQGLISLTELLEVKSQVGNLSKQFVAEGNAPTNSFREFREKLNTDLNAFSTSLSLAQTGLSRLALRSLLFETDSILSQTVKGLEQNGNSWLSNDSEKSANLLAALDRYLACSKNLSTQWLSVGGQEKERAAWDALVYARSILATPDKLPRNEDDDNQLGMNAVRSAERLLMEYSQFVVGECDKAEPDLKQNLAQSAPAGGQQSRSGGSSFIFIHHHIMSSSASSSYSSSPPINYGGRSFALGASKGGYSSPVWSGVAPGGKSATPGVARGGFGRSGVAHGSSGT